MRGLDLLAPRCQIEDHQRKRQHEEAVNQRAGDMESPSQKPQDDKAYDDGPDQDSLRANHRDSNENLQHEAKLSSWRTGRRRRRKKSGLELPLYPLREIVYELDLHMRRSRKLWNRHCQLGGK